MKDMTLYERTDALEKRVAELEAKWPPATHEDLVNLFEELHKAQSACALAKMELNTVMAKIEAAALQIKRP
ncbi:MAG: hypothetical protein IJ233_00790 [Pyramidobacter sp.]|nr:hypothetical protein [Pyramidobacter sp.]